jgi:hypothetical protein
MQNCCNAAWALAICAASGRAGFEEVRGLCCAAPLMAPEPPGWQLPGWWSVDVRVRLLGGGLAAPGQLAVGPW